MTHNLTKSYWLDAHIDMDIRFIPYLGYLCMYNIIYYILKYFVRIARFHFSWQRARTLYALAKSCSRFDECDIVCVVCTRRCDGFSRGRGPSSGRWRSENAFPRPSSDYNSYQSYHNIEYNLISTRSPRTIYYIICVYIGRRYNVYWFSRIWQNGQTIWLPPNIIRI